MTELKQLWSGWFARGLLMGIADMVPGISGGTIALITGIYARLIEALASFRFKLLGQLARGQLRSVWQQIDGTFLLVLLTGILTSILLMSHLVGWLLSEQPVVLWSFFLGVLLLALRDIVRRVSWGWVEGLVALGGALMALITVVAGGVTLEVTLAWLFLGGMLAITAMILPGISGSLILLLLGMYAPAVEAVRTLDWPLLLAFATGCASGILVFSRLLHWLMREYGNLALAGMCGIVAGAMPRLWPWQLESGRAQLQVRLPEGASELWLGILVLLAGMLVYGGLTWWRHRLAVGAADRAL
ncbi:MAG: DUF368 domain-containing protein [Natronospirillum sp.]|uniref:DUF368 domain-containing protein n=1 Tax=Natronospirillum sp. TaxID=2812955 RepID=UPI0025D66D58|nr:DUF368 domain-containing protein [Natronospirillum sp.]MCH8551606.1 DUF368 domain-containing protein [Natronospirillum sp.]